MPDLCRALYDDFAARVGRAACQVLGQAGAWSQALLASEEAAALAWGRLLQAACGLQHVLADWAPLGFAFEAVFTAADREAAPDNYALCLAAVRVFTAPDPAAQAGAMMALKEAALRAWPARKER